MARKLKKKICVSYKFDPVAIPDWRDRLADAYEMLFNKIDDMERKEKKQKGDIYGTQYFINN